MTSDALRKLVLDLGELSLVKELGENVETFNLKVSEIAGKIDQGIIYRPPDLSALVAEKYTTCSVMEFQMAAINHYNEIRKDPLNCDYQDIIDEYVDSYIYLVGANKWTPLQKQKETTNELQTLKNQIKALQQKQGNDNDSGEFKGRCWDCGQTGHRKGDPKCPAKTSPETSSGNTRNTSANWSSKPKDPPGNNDSH